MGLVVLVLWVIRQIVEANKQAGPPKGRPQAAPQQPQPQVQPQPHVACRRPGSRPIRCATRSKSSCAVPGACRPATSKPGAAPRSAAGGSEIEVLIDEPAAPTRATAACPSRSGRWNSRADSCAAATGGRDAQSADMPVQPVRHARDGCRTVAESVTAHSQALGEQTSHLGQRIIDDDQQFDVQLKAKFDHTVGTLTGSGRCRSGAGGCGSSRSGVACRCADRRACWPIPTACGKRSCSTKSCVGRATAGNCRETITCHFTNTFARNASSNRSCWSAPAEQPTCPECGSTRLSKLLSIVAAPTARFRGRRRPESRPGSCGSGLRLPSAWVSGRGLPPHLAGLIRVARSGSRGKPRR